MFQTFLVGANRTTFTSEIIKNVMFMFTQKLNAPCIFQQGQVTPVVGIGMPEMLISFSITLFRCCTARCTIKMLNWLLKVVETFQIQQNVRNGHVYIQVVKQHKV